MKTISVHEFQSPVGALLIGCYQHELVLCDWKYRKQRVLIDKRIQQGLEADFIEEIVPLHAEVMEQLVEYFKGERKTFDVPIRFVGSDFQQKVWRALCEIPYGSTKSYAALSETLGNLKAIRAVASANGANAISIFVPCHRVVGSSGELTGYAGGLPAKKKLLQIENSLHSAQLEMF